MQDIMSPEVFNPTDKQKEAHRLLKKNRILLYGGAIRGAKSHWGCMEIISLCYLYPNSRWAMLRKDRVVLEATLLKTFTENFLNKGWQQHVVSFPQDTLVLTWDNGSQILFMGENYDRDKDLNRFKGLEINGAFVDEVNETQEVTFDKIIERAGSWFHSPGCPSKILMSCNPTQNWVKKRFYDRHKANELPAGVAYLQARIFDNPYIPQDYLESLKMLPPQSYRVFVDGEWDVAMKTGNEFLRKFETDVHVKPNAWDINNMIHVSLDSNVYPYIAVSIWQLEAKGSGWKIKQVNELPAVDPINTATKAGKNVGEWLNKIGYKQRIMQYGDKSTKNRNNIDDNKKTFYDLFTEGIAKEGFRIEDKMLKAAPPVAGIADFVNAIFAGEIPGLEIEIGENCKESINDYIETKTDPNGAMLKKRITDPKTKISYEPHGHLCFVGETIIETDKGGKRIDEINLGDKVLTRSGYKKVTKVWVNGVKEVKSYHIGNKKLTCTPNHRVWTKENGFYPIGHLIGSKTFCILDENYNICNEILFITEVGDLYGIRNQKTNPKEAIIRGGLCHQMDGKKQGFTFSNTNAKLARYQKIITSTTLTAIRSIMNCQITNVNSILSTNQSTCRSLKGFQNRNVQLKLQEHQLLNGINRRPVASGIRSMLSNQFLEKKGQRFVKSAELNIQPLLKCQHDFVPNSINGNTRLEYNERNANPQYLQNAQHAGMRLLAKSTARENVILREVFDIEVEDVHEYFANGVLVHNCDTLKDFIVSAFNKEYLAFINKKKGLGVKALSGI